MKKFDYEARDNTTGKIVKANVQAESEHAAAKLLVTQGFVPLKIKESADTSGLLARLTSRITTKDRIVFTRQLSTLIGAGLPLSQSLRTVLDQTENKRLQGVIQDIIVSVEGGRSLSESFRKHNDVFDNVYLALIESGEASGTLDEALKRIALQKEKDAAMMSKIRGAMTYPIIVLLVIMAVMAFMLATVVPEVKKLYASMKIELPWLTQVMVSAADIVVSFWWLILIIIAGVAYLVMQYLRTTNGVRTLDNLKLNAPLFKNLFRKLYMARFARTGEVLLKTGVSMLDMLAISAQAVNNTVVAQGIHRAAGKVKGGKALSTSLKPEPYILSLVPQMIKIGEQSGRIDEMMGKTAQVYEDELDEAVRTLSTAIEPILMVLLAVTAGGMVGAILFPIYSLVNNVRI